MAGEQAASMQPETKSYDDDIMGDVQSAYTEANKEAPAETVVEAPAETKEVAPKLETPAEPRADHPTDKTRYADGTFKPTTDAKPAEIKQAEATKADQTKAPVEAVQQQPAQVTAVSAPPPGWSVKSKSEWDKLPDHIRADIAKREQEVSTGFAQYTGLKPVLKYADHFRARGTTLEAQLDRYMGIENLLAKDLLSGLLHIAGNAGIQPQQLAQALAPYAGTAAQPVATEGQQPQPAFDPNVLRQYINPLEQKLNKFEQFFTQQQQAENTRQESTLNGAIQRFSSDPQNRFFENVRPVMSKLFDSSLFQQTGDLMVDLKTAYDQACQLDPEIRDDRRTGTRFRRLQVWRLSASTCRRDGPLPARQPVHALRMLAVPI